jgi:hypothetical protein
MKNTLTTYEIADALLKDENAAWSYNGAKALAEYLDQYEEECGIELELDVIALRCEFTECSDVFDWGKSYFTNNQFRDLFDDVDGDELADALTMYIEERGSLIEFDGGIIVSSF